MPSPVTGRNRERPVGRLSAPADRPCDERRISRGCAGASIRIAQPNQHSAASTSAPARVRPRSLPPHRPPPQASRVGQQDRNAAERQRHLDMVPRGPRNIGDDRPLLPAIALIRLDFPAFGGPATTTRTPSFSGSTRGRSSHDLSPRQAPHNRAAAPDRAPHPPHHSRSRARPPRTGRATAPATRAICFLGRPPRARAQPCAAIRLRLDQVGQTFGFGQVDPAVLECAAGEFAGLRLPQPSSDAKRRKHCIDHRSSAMALKFDDIFARRARRRSRSAGPVPRRATRRAADRGAREPPPSAARAASRR